MYRRTQTIVMALSLLLSVGILSFANNWRGQAQGRSWSFMDERLRAAGAYNSSALAIFSSCTSAPTGLLSWWSGEGDAADRTGTHNGTHNGVTFTTGFVGQAMSFNGSAYVDLGNPGSLNLTGAMTIEGWIKVNAFTQNWQAVITKGDSAWRLHRFDSTNNISFATTGLSSTELQSTISINDGLWHHIAGVYDGATKYLYIDGALNTSIAATGTIATNSFPALIGENAQATGRQWNGLIDELSIYNRALSQAEIQNLFNAGSAGKCPCLNPTLTPASLTQAFAASGGPGSISISFAGQCDWSAITATTWITLNNPNGSGNGTLNYTVAVNSATSPRSGTIVINGRSFSVLQGAHFNDVADDGSLLSVSIGKLSARGITTGCGGPNYCPNSSVTRAQMAIFIERALGVFTPPAGPATPTFADVTTPGLIYDFIEDFVSRGITSGCETGPPRLYCPDASVTRAQMAVFIERALNVFTPPPGPGTPTFADVPTSHQFYNFIEDFANRGITSGCQTGPPRLYCPDASVTRGQMAIFLVRAFNL